VPLEEDNDVDQLAGIFIDEIQCWTTGATGAAYGEWDDWECDQVLVAGNQYEYQLFVS
jgi:hypothetical protein